MNMGYPRFETQVFAELPEILELVSRLPGVRRALFVDGVPCEFLFKGYTADPALTVLAWAGHAPVIRFGTSGLSEAIGVDTATGYVVEVINGSWMQVNLVNTTVELFTHTIKALINRFPYYPRGAGYDQIDSACEDLREIIRSVDPEASVSSIYWPGWVDDVQMGDCGTEDVLARRPPSC